MENLYKNVLDLCLYQGIEGSKKYLDILYLEIKMCKNQLEYLEIEKPKWFQKKKLERYQEEKKCLENKLSSYRQNVLKELELISKMSDN